MDEKLLAEVVAEQKEEFGRKLGAGFVGRGEESLVDLDSPLAQVVIGVRRSGKSTLCFNVIKSSGKKFAYANFDDERFSDVRAEDLNALLEELYKAYGDFGCLFLDEVQNVEGWHLFVNRLLRQGMRVLVTGSNAKLLSGELATHLTGRHLRTELYPFSFAEFCELSGVNLDCATTKGRAFVRAAFDAYLKDGGFPELAGEKRKQGYVAALVKSILANDIERRYAVRYKSAFEQLAEHVLNNVPFELNYRRLQETFGFKSAHTAENYVQFLKNAYLVIGLHKYSQKSKIRVRMEKLYAVDVALMNRRENAFAGENLGWRLETVVYIELLRRYRPQEMDVYYYAESSAECDFVVAAGREVRLLVQVAYDLSEPKVLRRELRGLLAASKAIGCKNALLLTYADERTLETDGLSVPVLPVYKWSGEGAIKN